MPKTDFIAPNGDNTFEDFSGLYSKGLKQDTPGIVNPASADAFVNEIMRGKSAPKGPINPALFEDTALVLGNTDKSGRLNGPQGAFAGHLVGKTSSSDYTTVAPPKVGSEAYAVELAELYWASLLRDAPFRDFYTLPSDSRHGRIIAEACKDLTKWAKQGWYQGPVNSKCEVTPALLFRGGVPANTQRDYPKTGSPGKDPKSYFAGETVGPYVSQLCLAPTFLGAQVIDQRINVLAPGRDYMTDLGSWSNVQNGKAVGEPLMDPIPRHIRNGRDLASFTRVDELYQAYLTAFLVMANTWKAPSNPMLPYNNYKNSMRTDPGMGYVNQKPFGTMGSPEITAFLGTVAREAINVVWWHKWAKHLRARPEAGGGLVHLWKTGAPNQPIATAAFNSQFDMIMAASLAASSARYSPRTATTDKDQIFLLSQAFPEGSPTHPAYPTGHGAVAGACITALKFFFNGEAFISDITEPMVASLDGLGLEPYEHDDAKKMTVNGELHKVAHNISFGHGILAGIHWRTDTDESLLLGEQVAISCLDALVNTYSEDVNVMITLMDGTKKTFTNETGSHAAPLAKAKSSTAKV